MLSPPLPSGFSFDTPTAPLARLAQHDPALARRAGDRLDQLLDADRADIRQNACWALGRLGRQAALPRLTTLQTTDPDEAVRAAAVGTVRLLTTTHCPRCRTAVNPHEASITVESSLRSHWTCPVCDETITERVDG